MSPLEIKKRFEQGKRDKLVNIVFLDHDDQLIMSLVRRMGPSRAVYLSKDEFYPTSTTTLNGACSRYFCPFVPGLYPDKSDLKFSEL